MKNVKDFIAWGLKRTKRSTCPNNAISLPIKKDQIGSAGEHEYLYGSYGQRASNYLLNLRFKSFYSKNGWTRAQFDTATSGWVANGVHVTDCNGLLDEFLQTDTSANGNYVYYCTSKGLCAEINRPYVVGEAVFNGSSTKKTHVGFVCGFTPGGDVLVMEARGLSYGVVITKMSSRSWKYRGLMTKKFSYSGAAVQPAAAAPFQFTRVLKYGCTGADVIALKELLIEKGYSGVTATNKNFLGSTREVVKQFQRNSGLTVDGKAGKNTISALGGVWKG